MNTPWGLSQGVNEVADGFGEVDTPGHGGVYVTPTAAARLGISEACLGLAEVFEDAYWFEEDCQASVILWETKHYWPNFYPHCYGPGGVGESGLEASFLKSLSRWNPDYLLSCGSVPNPEALADYQEQVEYEHHADDRVVGILTSQEDDDLRDEGFVVGYLDAGVFELLAANIKTFDDRAERKLGQGLLEDIDYSLVTTQEGVRVRVVAQRAADDDPDED